MEASIREPHIKDFVKLLQCASKFGDDLNMHATQHQWELAVTNSSRSAFCLFKLKRSFFCRYKAHGDTEVQKRRGVKCLLLVKSVLAVLGKATTMNNVERLDLTIIDPEQSLRPKRNNRQSSGLTNQDEQDEADYQEIMGDDVNSGIEAKLIMKLVCKHGVTKKHSLHLASSEFLRAEVDPNSTPSSFTVSARALRDMLDHFSIATGSASGGGERNGIRTENQLGWMFAKREVRVKTYEAGAGVGGLSTEIKVDNGEFDEYWVEGERVDLTLPMKEFRAALTLAEQLSISLTIAFSEATQPLTLTSDVEESKDWDFDIFCAIATTDFAGFSDVVPTGQPPSGRSGGGGGGGRSGRGSVPPSKQENDDDNGDAQDDRASRSGTARSRAESQGPGKRKRPSLNLSANTSSRSTSIIHRSGQGPSNSAAGSQRRQNGQEPLFLSNSQGPSQRVLSQQELLELTGFGQMSELEDALDDEDEADELEARRLAAEAESGGGRPDRDDGIMQDSFNLPEGNGSLFGGGGDDQGQNGGGFSKVEETIEEDQRAEEEPAEGIDEEMDEDELDDTQPDKEFPSFFPDEDDMVSTRSKRSKPSDDPSGSRGR